MIELNYVKTNRPKMIGGLNGGPGIAGSEFCAGITGSIKGSKVDGIYFVNGVVVIEYARQLVFLAQGDWQEAKAFGSLKEPEVVPEPVYKRETQLQPQAQEPLPTEKQSKSKAR